MKWIYDHVFATGLWRALLAVLACGVVAAAQAGEAVVTVHTVTVDGVGAAVGTVRFADSRFGLLVTPDLHDLTAGPHGMHVHENPDCGPSQMGGEAMPAGAAGGHYDPEGTGRHEGPYGTGHLGDLPNLYVEHDGTATIPVLAPRLEAADIQGRSLMLHAMPDRYAGHAHHHHGKGGMRMYCGVIE
jgi:Cu-Zn family superoxide dismutase